MIPAMARGKTDSDEKSGEKKKDGQGRDAVAAARVKVAQVLWLLFVLCALFLAIGALLVALDANEDNPLVELVVNGANAVDLGVFSRDNGIFDFSGSGAEVKNALVNWGIGAVAYLVVGRILDRIVRP
jgi:hypothetical protein